MDLEKVLAEDRIDFEAKIAFVKDQSEQYRAAMDLYGRFFSDATEVVPHMPYLRVRIDAFMIRCVTYKVCREIVGHVLRSTVSSAKHYPNRNLLAAYYQTFPPVEFLSDINRPLTNDIREHLAGPQPSHAKLVELKALCGEYDEWFTRMREISKTADPKNHPTNSQLRERDAIRVKINELATPDVISALVSIAMKERGEA